MSDETHFPNRFVNKARIYHKEFDTISSISHSLQSPRTEISPYVVQDGERINLRTMNRTTTVDNIDEVRDARHESSRLTVNNFKPISMADDSN